MAAPASGRHGGGHGVKTVDQHARLTCHRVREGYKTEALATSNRLGGLLAEFGVVVAQNDHALRRALAELSVRSALPVMLLELLDDVTDHWQQVRNRIAAYDARIATHAKVDQRSVRIQQLIGIGTLTADTMVATVGSARELKNGRQTSAWPGLTPTQHSTGGRSRLGEISCRGDSYLRTLLIQGARRSLQRANAVSREKATPGQLWIQSLSTRLPFGKLLVAIANKHARQLLAMLAREETYDADAWAKHPMAQRPKNTRITVN